MEEDDFKRWTTGRHEEPPSYKTTSTHGAKHYCYTCIIATICVLIVVVLFGAGAFYWYIFEYRDSSLMPTYIEVPISMKIDMEYTGAYGDPSSPEYMNFIDGYITEVDKVFTNTKLNDTYLQSIVYSLSAGSVAVNSSSIFTNKPDSNKTLPLQNKLDTLQKEIEQIINDAISDGMLGNELPVVPSSLLLIGTPKIIQVIPDDIIPVPERTTTEIPPVVTTKTLTNTPMAVQSTEAILTTLGQDAACQSPSEVILDVSTPYDLFSPNYPDNYPPNTLCQWIIRAPSGHRIRGHFNQLYLEDAVDVLHVGTGIVDGEFDLLAYSGTTAQVPLDIVSPGRVLVFTWDSNEAVEAKGFSVRFEVVDPPDDDQVTCNNGLEILVADDICDGRVECNDGSDETDCYDLLRTGICGTQIPLTRILGGQDSLLGSMPWVGSVRTAAGAHYCGASLLTDQWAVTAAHCIKLADHLYFGGLSLDTPLDYEERFDISVIFAHPDYNILTENNDIALIRLTRPVKISAAIRPICIAHVTGDVEEMDVYANCKAVGWGASNSMGGLNPVLKETDMPLVPRATCDQEFDSMDGDSSATRICAGGIQGTDTCTGDNGGPLVCRGDNGLWHIVGVTTRSSKCNSADVDVYTRLSAYHHFILYTVTQTDVCIGTPFELFCLDGCVGGEDCQTQCNDDQIRCKIGNCISETKACDDAADCLDSTDEGGMQNCTTEGCGGVISITLGAFSTTIASLGFPNDYQSFLRCQWTVRTMPGNQIRLTFDNFDTEELYDFLHIGMDTDVNSMLMTFSGDNIPIDVLSVKDVIVLTFEADYSLEKSGFSLQADAISESEIGALTTCSNGMQIIPDPQQRNIQCNGVSDCYDNSDEIECECHGEPQRTAPMGGIILIQSKNYGNGGYPEGAVPCQWIVNAATPSRRLLLTFLDFKTESGYDFVTIATGLEEGATVVSYSGYNTPPGIVSSSSQVVITFQTDDSGSAEGFNLLVEDIDLSLADEKMKCGNNLELLADDDICDGIPDCTDGTDEPETCKCGDVTLYIVVDGTPTDLTSANYPSNYLNSAECQWLAVLQNPNKKLLLHFSDFTLEDKVDVLYIGSLNFSGSKIPPDIISPTGELQIQFATDRSISMRGYSLTLSAVDPTVIETYNFCDNGLEVLEINDVCNDVIDCSDGSDESNCGA